MLLALLLMLASQVTTETLQERYLLGKLAKDDLLAFSRLTMPYPDDPVNVRLSRYEVARHHRLIAERVMQIARQPAQRLVVVLPPRHGKSELVVRRFVPWLWGRDARRHVIVATYTSELAWDHGRDVRNIMRSPEYRVVFNRPESQLRSDSQACDRLETVAGGKAFFVGLKGSITGRGADVFVIDDPIKGSEEARSKLIRDKIWNNFIEVCLSRLMTDQASVVIISTRWHEDDLVGRLTDPSNEHCNPAEAKRWHVLHLRALIESEAQSKADALGRRVGESLWPERFSAEHLRHLRDISPPLSVLSFGAVYQGDPSPEEGSYFKKDWLKTYEPAELPKNLRKYATSDHAFKEKASNDCHCLMPFGVDESGCIWILPDLVWDKSDSMVMVEAQIDMMDRHRPLTWWAAKDNISGSVGPFLRQRMRERKVFVAIDEVPETVDLQQRSQSIKGRASMGMVRFPGFAPWWPRALNELLKFPNAPKDDFVAALALVGMGLDRQVSAPSTKPPVDGMPRPGTLEWVKKSTEFAERERARARSGE